MFYYLTLIFFTSVGNNTSSQKTAYPFNYQILKDANDNSNSKFNMEQKCTRKKQ